MWAFRVCKDFTDSKIFGKATIKSNVHSKYIYIFRLIGKK